MHFYQLIVAGVILFNYCNGYRYYENENVRNQGKIDKADSAKYLFDDIKEKAKR